MPSNKGKRCRYEMCRRDVLDLYSSYAFPFPFDYSEIALIMLSHKMPLFVLVLLKFYLWFGVLICVSLCAQGRKCHCVTTSSTDANLCNSKPIVRNIFRYNCFICQPNFFLTLSPTESPIVKLLYRKLPLCLASPTPFSNILQSHEYSKNSNDSNGIFRRSAGTNFQREETFIQMGVYQSMYGALHNGKTELRY